MAVDRLASSLMIRGCFFQVSFEINQSISKWDEAEKRIGAGRKGSSSSGGVA
jgi:hypothetical protein